MKMLQKRKSFAALISLVVLGLSSQAMAQDGLLLDDGINATDAEIKTVEDSFKAKAELTAEEKKILAERKAQMDKKHLEELRLKEQKKIAGQLKTAIVTPIATPAKKKSKAINKKRRITKKKTIRRRRITRNKKKAKSKADRIVVTQSARKKSVAKAPSKGGILGGRDLKVIPFGGIANIKKDSIDLSTKVNAGVLVEGEISERFTVGAGFRYTTLDFQDNANPVTAGFGAFATNTPSGREVEFRGMNLELNSKFFFTNRDAFIRPFVGAAVGYNRHKMEYSDQGQQQFVVGATVGDKPEYTSTMVTGSAILGAEANFSDTLGAYVAGRYTRGLTDASSGDAAATTNDQQQLNAFGAVIDEANVLGVNAGLVIKF